MAENGNQNRRSRLNKHLKRITRTRTCDVSDSVLVILYDHVEESPKFTDHNRNITNEIILFQFEDFIDTKLYKSMVKANTKRIGRKCLE